MRCGRSLVLLASLLLVPLTAEAQQVKVPIRPQDGVRQPGSVVGAVQPGYLGLGGDDLPTAGHGIRVKDVVVGAPAAMAGIIPGDTIISVNGDAVSELDDLTRAIGAKQPGDVLQLVVERQGETKTFAVTLGERAGRPIGTIAPSDAIALGPKLGVRTRELNDLLRTQFDVPADTRGVLVTEVTPGTPAEQAGIPVGAVITAVDGKPVASLEQLSYRIRSAGPGQAIDVRYLLAGKEQHGKAQLGPGGVTGVQGTLRPSPAGADATDFIPPGSPVADQQRIEELEERVKQLEQRIKILEAALKTQ